MPEKRPSRQVCPLCGNDDNVVLDSEGPDMWLYTCSGRAHHSQDYSWPPSSDTVAPTGRTQIGEDLGVYDDLIGCVHPGERVEYGVVECRFAQQSPNTYAELVAAYGHTSLANTRYSASVFLAHALGQLAREGLLHLSWTEGTGYWSYLRRVSAWALPSTPDNTPITSWASYATKHGLSATSWPYADTR